MADTASFAATWTPRGLSILRIITALLMMQHGGQKLFGFPPTGKPSMPFDITSMVGIGGIIEFVGALLLLFGLFTRPVAFILSGTMAVAYFWGHAGLGEKFFPIINKGELAVLFCFVFLFFAIAGGGTWSLDRLWRGSRTPYSVPT